MDGRGKTDGGWRGDAAGDEAPQLRTSSAIEEMMRSYADGSQRAAAQREARSRQSADEAGPVELTCIIAKGSGVRNAAYYNDPMWRIGLRISRGKTSYVVKSIGDLVRAWRYRQPYSYGKNLSFVHDRDAFDGHANKLLEALSDIVDAQWSMFYLREMRCYSAGKLTTKTLPLKPWQFAGILDLELGREVVYEYHEEVPGAAGRYGRRRGEFKLQKATIPVADGNPQLDVEIEAHPGGGGYDLRVSPADLEYIDRDGGRGYLIGTQGAFRTTGEFTASLGPFCESVLPALAEFHISEASMPTFCATVLPALHAHTNLSEPEELGRLIPPQPEFAFHIGEDDGIVSCHATARYGDAVVGLFDDARKNGPVRDIVHEMAAQSVVREFFPQGDTATPAYDAKPYGLTAEGRVFGSVAPDRREPYFAETDAAAYYALLQRGLAALSQLGDVFLSDRLRRARVRPSPGVRVEARLGGGFLKLGVDSGDLSDEELMAYLSSYKRKQRYVLLEDGDILRIDGALEQVAEVADALGVEPEGLVGKTAELPPSKTLFVDAMLKRAGGVRFDRDEAFRRVVRDFETVADSDVPLPAGLHATMRPYQEDGYRWLCLLGKMGFGGILADDMGLGKTLQAIAYFCHAAEKGETRPALVVCPASLVYNWTAEIARFAPALKAVPVLGAKEKRAETLGRAGGYRVFVTSYDLMKRDIDLYDEIEFSTVVLDEAQYIKNSSTKAAKCARELRAHARFALTGTPIENNLLELWSIFEFLMPGSLGTERQFAQRYDTDLLDDAAKAATAKRLQALVGPFMLRRVKSQVLDDLPDKDESIVYAQMEGEQRKLYQAHASRLARSLEEQQPEEFRESKLQVLAELTKLRQLACDPRLVFDGYEGGSAKLDTAVDLVTSAVEGGHSLLLFSQFTSMFPLIRARLERAGVFSFELTGSTPKEERVRLVERFQRGERPVFLISLKAGGVGLNLTAADIVIHYDPWWNLAAQNQATDRAYRIGQTRDVSVFKIIAKDTVEERIVQMQEAKQDLADSIVGGEAIGSSKLTREDVLALLGARD